MAAISTATDKVVDRITTNGPRPASVAIGPDGKYVYTADFSDNMVDVISTASDSVTGVVHLPLSSYPVAIAADADFLFTADYTSAAVSEFDIQTNYQSEGEIPAGGGPDALALVPAN